MNSTYKSQVHLLLRILPIIYKEKDFAVHGGTAINLFVKNMLRYSVDVDLTYIPLESRETSLRNINAKLVNIGEEIKRIMPIVRIKSVPEKLLCTMGTNTVKIEVNAIQRGLIGEVIDLPLCNQAQKEFELFCKARVVSISQLYGGKLGAALNRQHPRDLFDYKYMDIADFATIKHGLVYNILSSPKPVVELLSPNPIDQTQTLENQFWGMTDIPFTYENYIQARQELIAFVNSNISRRDKDFFISYEDGCPQWDNSEYESFKKYPSIQWKQLNILKLKVENPTKHRKGVEKITNWLLTYK
jgi:predicted nucleotidyltransferase component of viral defense system